MKTMKFLTHLNCNCNNIVIGSRTSSSIVIDPEMDVANDIRIQVLSRNVYQRQTHCNVSCIRRLVYIQLRLAAKV